MKQNNAKHLTIKADMAFISFEIVNKNFIFFSRICLLKEQNFLFVWCFCPVAWRILLYVNFGHVAGVCLCKKQEHVLLEILLGWYTFNLCKVVTYS